jgi:hypothetical protein
VGATVDHTFVEFGCWLEGLDSAFPEAAFEILLVLFAPHQGQAEAESLFLGDLEADVLHPI